MAATENGKKLDTVSRTSTEAIPAKVKWDSPIEFILACLGYAVGLGNVWRFPYLCYRNGGGAFLIPFFLMLVFIGLPLFYLELYIGQYTGLGPLQAFAAIAPAFSGLGYCTVVIICYVCIYFMVIVAWNLFYTIVSLTGNLGWGSCDNSFNSAFCYSGSYDKDCRVNNTGSSSDLTFYLKTCMSVGDICVMSGREPLNGTHCDLDGEPVNWYSNITRVLASEEYYNERVLGRGDATWEQWGELQWHLVGCLFASWLITFFVVIKGEIFRKIPADLGGGRRDMWDFYPLKPPRWPPSVQVGAPGSPGERTGVTSHRAAALLRETQGFPTPSQPARLYMATCTAALPGAAIMRRLGPPSSPPTAPNLLLVAFYDGQEIP
ncbi:unnamed protein product [Plutella xylostella]|uniref:Transporter n=1 Tax=Plutella xylostella TaxID=51655 RepID=A0A8S4G3S7_PLUXY|nr:unnamed protein product [Plutella xylostella]